MPGADWWHLNWHWLFWPVVIVVLLRLVVQWIRISASRDNRSRHLAAKVPRLRYLSGEIDRQEYKRRLNSLRRLQGKS